MARFTNFKDWKSGKQSSVKEGDAPIDDKKQASEKTVAGNAELLALIEELAEKRNAASREKDGIGRQIYDLDIRVAKLEMQKNELLAKKKELEAAKNISEIRKRTPRTNHE
jgi:hypothetical protein